MVQDCRIGSTTDGKLVPVYEYPVTLAKEVMGEQSISEIAAAYPQLSKAGVILELEAFAVAAMNDPIEQVQDIRNYCF